MQRRGPVDRGCRVPLAGEGLGVQLGDDVGPDLVAAVQIGVLQRRAAVLDEGAPGGEAPRVRGAVDDSVRTGPGGFAAGAYGAAPAVVVGGSLANHEFPVVAGVDRVAVGSRPGRQVDLQMRVAALHRERVSRGEPGERPFDEEGGTTLESEPFKVDSPAQR
jgi:hypothetical protein